MSSIKSEADDLEKITGIGPDVRKWLAESFDVRTFSALANLSVVDLIDRIKADNKPSIWLRWVEKWPVEAKQMAEEMGSNAQISANVINERRFNLPVTELSPESSNHTPNNSAKGKNGWETLALYFIEFLARKVSGKPDELLTKVVFEGPGPQSVVPFPDIELEGAIQWILEHASGILQTELEKETESITEIKEQRITLSPISVSQFNLFQPTDVDTPLLSFSGNRSQFSIVTANQPLAIEVFLEDSRAKNTNKFVNNFNVQFNVKNMDTNEYTSLGTVEPKKLSDHKAYSAFLPNVCLQRGMYRLYVLVLSQPKLRLLDSFEIQFLNVY